MGALRYLTLTTLKNGVKELKKRPSRLVAYLLFIAVMVFLVISGNSANEIGWEPRPVQELGLIILAFYGLAFVTDVFKGFSSGATFFTMADVNSFILRPDSPETDFVLRSDSAGWNDLMGGAVYLF